MKNERLAYFVMRPIIQFSPPRTGSTLLYNSLRICFPDKEIWKKHRLDAYIKKIRSAHIISSIRNPVDSVASSILRYGENFSDREVKKQITEIQNHGMMDILNIRKSRRVKIIKYEEFFDNFDFLFCSIEDHFKQNIPEDRKLRVKKEFNILDVYRKSSNLGTFDQLDQQTQIHGNHISEKMGGIGYGRELLSKRQIKLIYSSFKPIFDAFEYAP